MPPIASSNGVGCAKRKIARAQSHVSGTRHRLFTALVLPSPNSAFTCTGLQLSRGRFSSCPPAGYSCKEWCITSGSRGEQRLRWRRQGVNPANFRSGSKCALRILCRYPCAGSTKSMPFKPAAGYKTIGMRRKNGRNKSWATTLSEGRCSVPRGFAGLLRPERDPAQENPFLNLRALFHLNPSHESNAAPCRSRRMDSLS